MTGVLTLVGIAEQPPPCAFETFAQAEWPRVQLALVKLFGIDPQTAADPAQDALIEVQRRWHDLHSPRAYLMRTAINRHRRYRRRLRREVLTDVLTDKCEPLWAAPRLDPAELVAIGEGERRVQAVLRTLPQRQRQVMILNHLDLTTGEIAQILGIVPGAVRNVKARARNNLKKRFEAMKGAGGGQES
jgi:RNA polymerase sigma factor (sigma-70 family)